MTFSIPVSKLNSEILISYLSGWCFRANSMYAILAFLYDEHGSISRTSNSFLILKLKQVFWVLGGGKGWGDGELGNDDLGGGDWKEVVSVEKVIHEFRLPIQVSNCRVEGRICQYYILILIRLVHYLLYVSKYVKTYFYQQRGLYF